MREPKVIEPPDYDIGKAWKACREFVDRNGGLVYENGEPNMMAASGADPGVCTCPNCGEYYWSFGMVIECLDCGFQFPVSWWPMYSFGVQAAKDYAADYSGDDPAMEYRRRRRERLKKLHDKRLEDPYYRYGFNHPSDDPYEESKKIDWATVL